MRFAAFPGHFPGDPIVPGAAILEAVADQLGLVGMERMRFLAVVRPGETLDLRQGGPGDRVHFSVWRGETEVARGIGWRRKAPARP